MAVTLRLAVSSMKCLNLRPHDVYRVFDTSLLKVVQVGSYDQTRNCSFFRNSETAESMFDSLTGVSNVGLKRGRGRNTRKRIDLHKSQIVGMGKSGMVWPGLNMQAEKDRVLTKIHQQTPNQEYFDKIIEARTKRTFFRKLKLPVLERGWTGSKRNGMKCGPPDPIGDYDFKGFDSRILELKQVSNMTATKKNKFRYSCMVVTGNKNGLGGFALAKATNANQAVKKAKNSAAQQLQYIKRYDEHTLYHNFFSQQTATKIFAYRKHEGYGLVCHRALKTICEVLGIKDMYAKCEGSTGNIQNVTKAFFYGLRKQETHQELADRMNLHVVEIRKERDNLPILVASPSDGKVRKEPLKDEEANLDYMYFGQRLPYNKGKKPPFWSRHPGHLKAERQKYVYRNRKSARIERLVYNLEHTPTFLKLKD